MNKKFVYQVGDNKKKLYYDARPTKYQNIKSLHMSLIIFILPVVSISLILYLSYSFFFS